MTQPENKNVLVTGGLGYIGSHTVVKLIENGYTPYIIDNLSNSYLETLDSIKEITGIKPYCLRGDISDEEGKNNMIYLLGQKNIGHVIHFAAYKSVSESVENPFKYYNNNVGGLICLLKQMENHNVKNIVFSSSCTVYGEPKEYPVNEEMEFGKTSSPYGETKQMCENILMGASKKFINAVSLRYFNPIGSHDSGILFENPRENTENLMPHIIKVLKREVPCLDVYGKDYETKDGTAVRDYIDINDLAEAHVAALNIVGNKNYDAINVGSGNGYTVLDIVNAFKSFHKTVPYQIKGRRPGDIPKIYGDITKAKEVMGWEPKRNIKDSINSILNSLERKKV